MPKFLILDADAFDRAVVHEAEVSDPRAAVEAVPTSTQLPTRIVVVNAERVGRALVVAEDPSTLTVVRRPASD